MIHHFRHLLLLPLLNDPALAPSVATSIAPWTTPDPSLAPSVAPAIAPWSTARTIYHSFFGPWSIAWSTHHSFYCSLIHRLHHPSLLLFSLVHPWSTTRSIHRSFYWSLIHRSHHPSLLLLLPDPSLATSVAPSIAPRSTARTIHCSLDDLKEINVDFIANLCDLSQLLLYIQYVLILVRINIDGLYAIFRLICISGQILIRLLIWK